MRRGLVLALLAAFLSNAGCGGKGKYGLQVVFPDEESIGVTSRLVVWVLEPGAGTCDQLMAGEVDPEDMTRRNRLVISDPREGASDLRLRDVPDGRLLFFVEGQTEAGGKILRGCEEVRVRSGAKLMVTVTLAWVCHPSPQGEIVGNNEDDDCDGLTDECDSDLDCDDGNGCTSDICTLNECHNSPFPNALQCNDGDACTRDDACWEGICTGTGKDCSMYNGLCKVGECDPVTGQCGSEPEEDGTDCQDGLYCTEGDSCRGGLCVGSARDCGDQDGCTVDSCNDVSDCCEHVLVPRPGEEGPVGDGTCADGLDNDCDGLTDGLDPNCIVCAQDAECDDGNTCTDDSCAPPDCVNAPVGDGMACDDGLWCTHPDACSDGVCVGPARDCSGVADACHDGVCVEGNDACEARDRPEGAGCDDGLWCTVNDACSGGSCLGTDRDCDDDDLCTADSCDETNDRCDHELQPDPGAEGPPGNPTCGNGIDDDCDGLTDADDDSCCPPQSGDLSEVACEPPSGCPANPWCRDLAALMHFDRDAGVGESDTFVYDWSGSGNHGECSGSGCPAFDGGGGKFAGAFVFDGVDDWFDTGYDEHLDEWSVSVWVKAEAAPGSAHVSGPVMKKQNFQLCWDHYTSTYRGAVSLEVGGKWYGAKFGTLEGGVWIHLAATYDGETLLAYKNGDLITTNESPSGNPGISEYPLRIGRHENAGEYFAGAVDDAAVWKRALPPEEITDLYVHTRRFHRLP